TPQPTAQLKELLVDELTTVTKGTTYDNLSNLANNFKRAVISKYEGTRLGRQELNAEVLVDVVGALWARGMIEKIRVRVLPDMVRVVVAIDPPVTSGSKADECGLVVAGLGADGRGYVLDDKSSAGLSPKEWAAKAIDAYHLHNADRIIAEVNNGGELVEAVIRQIDETVSYTAVHASRGKVTRAEPISALYEQSRVSHVGTFATLEDRMCAFTVGFDRKSMGYSPDRVDALVWALTNLMLAKPNKIQIRTL
ncbi:MAG: DNA-packaging protein, partial [Kordiimonadaceae bacterium]|nr:DNA-packaging protein [Kordiimonadaceae bacterium]